MNGGRNSSSGDGQQQADYPNWIKPTLIAEAKQVLRASNRPGEDQDAIDLIVALGRLLDAAGILKGKRP